MSSRPRIAVLGGSTPFIASFFDAIIEAGFGPGTLVLHGRDSEALDLLGAHGQARLAEYEWTVEWTTNHANALDDAEFVIHQIRYGALEGRSDDESLAQALGIAGDETLGPAGLAAALRMADPLRETARLLRQHCPHAIVLNLTNPLSLSTSLLDRWGLQTLGICELPLHTLGQVCQAVGVQTAEVEWAYHGLNHRGFLHHVELAGSDLLPALLAALDGRADKTIGGVHRDEIERLDAVPLKYFAHFGPTPPRTAGRAATVSTIRSRALAELRSDPRRIPPSLSEREQPWYAEAVVPLLAALGSHEPANVVVSLAGDDGLAHEVRAAVSATGVQKLTGPSPSAEVQTWLDRFESHEQASLDAALEPSPANIRVALMSDPLLPADLVDQACALFAQVLAAQSR